VAISNLCKEVIELQKRGEEKEDVLSNLTTDLVESHSEIHGLIDEKNKALEEEKLMDHEITKLEAETKIVDIY
jgi:hypothetical protein